MGGKPKTPHLTHERLCETHHYDPITGIFTLKKPTAHADHRKTGVVAGSMDHYGYIVVCIDQEHIKAHRLAWFYMTGGWPPSEIDHRDCQKDNNAWANLRSASPRQNKANTPAYSTSATGIKGVYRRKNGRYYSTIMSAYKWNYLGSFDTAEEAHAAYVAAAERLHGEYARAA